MVGLLGSRVQRGTIVAIYAAKGSELSCDALERALLESGAHTAYPRCDGENLRFCEATRQTLRPARFGLMEPSPTAEPLDSAAITAVVVPGLAFDRDGVRLGWGKGYYDRFLARYHGLSIGYAFDLQVLKAGHVPHDATDQRVHHVCTERGVIV